MRLIFTPIFLISVSSMSALAGTYYGAVVMGNEACTYVEDSALNRQENYCGYDNWVSMAISGPLCFKTRKILAEGFWMVTQGMCEKKGDVVNIRWSGQSSEANIAGIASIIGEGQALMAGGILQAAWMDYKLSIILKDGRKKGKTASWAISLLH